MNARKRVNSAVLDSLVILHRKLNNDDEIKGGFQSFQNFGPTLSNLGMRFRSKAGFLSRIPG